MHKFCPHCGNEITKRPELAEDSWETYADCIKCKIRFHEVYGDKMGGSQDTIYEKRINK